MSQGNADHGSQAGEPAAGLIKARVRPGNTYGHARIGSDSRAYQAGEIVEVSAKELAQLSHCLIAVEEDDKARVKIEQQKRGLQDPAFEAARAASIARHEASVEAQRLHAKIAEEKARLARKK